MGKKEVAEVAELFKQRPLDEPGEQSDLEMIFNPLLSPGPETNEPDPETNEADPETDEAPEETERPMLEKFTEVAVLKCLLTEKEMRECAEQMAKIMGDLSEAQAELKSVSAQYKATIAKYEQHLSEEAAKYRAGHEFRPIQVDVYFDYETGRVWKIREDTGKTVEDRVMTAKEAQRKIWPEL